MQCHRLPRARPGHANPCCRPDAESRGEAMAGHAAGQPPRRAGAAGAPDRQDAAAKRTLFGRSGCPASWHASTHASTGNSRQRVRASQRSSMLYVLNSPRSIWPTANASCMKSPNFSAFPLPVTFRAGSAASLARHPRSGPPTTGRARRRGRPSRISRERQVKSVWRVGLVIVAGTAACPDAFTTS